VWVAQKHTENAMIVLLARLTKKLNTTLSEVPLLKRAIIAALFLMAAMSLQISMLLTLAEAIGTPITALNFPAMAKLALQCSGMIGLPALALVLLHYGASPAGPKAHNS
jgi:hypothetical protein